MAGAVDKKKLIAELAAEKEAERFKRPEDADPNDDNFNPDDEENPDEAAPAEGEEEEPPMRKGNDIDALIEAAVAKALADHGIVKAAPPADEAVVETYTDDELFKGIGAEFTRALSLALIPLVAKIETISEENAELRKAVEELGVLAEEGNAKSDSIVKALGSVEGAEEMVKGIAAKQEEIAKSIAAVGETTPTSGATDADLSEKSDGAVLSGEERDEANRLITKGMSLNSEGIVPAGLVEATTARNGGYFSREHLQALRKGVEVAEKNAETLVK